MVGCAGVTALVVASTVALEIVRGAENGCLKGLLNFGGAGARLEGKCMLGSVDEKGVGVPARMCVVWFLDWKGGVSFDKKRSTIFAWGCVVELTSCMVPDGIEGALAMGPRKLCMTILTFICFSEEEEGFFDSLPDDISASNRARLAARASGVSASALPFELLAATTFEVVTTGLSTTFHNSEAKPRALELSRSLKSGTLSS